MGDYRVASYWLRSGHFWELRLGDIEMYVGFLS